MQVGSYRNVTCIIKFKMTFENYLKHQYTSNLIILNKLKRITKFLLCLFVLAYVCKSAVTYHDRSAKTVLTLDMNVWQLLEEGGHYSLKPRDDISPKFISDNRPGRKFNSGGKDYTFKSTPAPASTTGSLLEEEIFFVKDLSQSAINNDGTMKKAKDGQHVLLVWWPPAYLAKDRNFLERNFHRACGGCRLTMDRTYLNRSAVVLFDNVPTNENLEDLPLAMSRRENQVYVLWHRETPSKTYHLRKVMEGVFDTMFNYTMSYRRDSDIVWYLGNTKFAMNTVPYAMLRQPGKYIDQAIAAKRKLAVWVVSNCNNTRGAIVRQKYVQKLLDAGLDIDMYGKCFNRELPKKDFNAFLAPYKFYMAFENSWHCKDYLTEKFWRNGLMANVVPVVWGPSKEDVAAVAPEHSYIHAEDFQSPEGLVEHLKSLDKNMPQYRRFFDWRYQQKIDESDNMVNLWRPGYEPAMCKLCMQVKKNGGKMPPKTLQSSISWVFGNDPNSQCLLDRK